MKLRFAPSPTGYLHIGNVRTALVNWLYARKGNGTFLLRMDDTDPERSRPEYAAAIEEDLRWLGLEWDEFARQSDRSDAYDAARQKLVEIGRLYPCYETKEELDIQRKFQRSAGRPPIYDRSALKLTDEQKRKYEAEGRSPHWRFKLDDTIVSWNDEVRGIVTFEGRSMSDPVLLRGDGLPTYTLSSVVDDAELGVTHVIRGEDHVSNTAVQIQLFEALYDAEAVPGFAHLALIRSKEGEMSKREGGYDIRSLRAKGIEPMAITSLLARLGTSAPIEAQHSLEALVAGFDIHQFGRSPAQYNEAELERLTPRILTTQPYEVIEHRLQELDLQEVDKDFWLAVRGNLSTLNDLRDWWNICQTPLNPLIDKEELDFTRSAAELLPQGDWDGNTWSQWIAQVKDTTGRKGKALFMPIRKALTARENGPELRDMLPLIGRERAHKRLLGETA